MGAGGGYFGGRGAPTRDGGVDVLTSRGNNPTFVEDAEGAAVAVGDGGCNGEGSAAAVLAATGGEGSAAAV